MAAEAEFLEHIKFNKKILSLSVLLTATFLVATLYSMHVSIKAHRLTIKKLKAEGY